MTCRTPCLGFNALPLVMWSWSDRLDRLMFGPQGGDWLGGHGPRLGSWVEWMTESERDDDGLLATKSSSWFRV